MLSIFKSRPDAPKVDYSGSHKGRGRDYHRTFADKPGRSLMWDMEQRVLKSLIEKLELRVALDFACGTGRITGLLTEELPNARVVGVDVSDSMLEVARANVPDSEFFRIDGRNMTGLFDERSVDLVTAIRFFANADPDLREAATNEVAQIVRPGGHVIVNNHRNFWSLSYISRRARLNAAAPGCLNSEVIGPFLEKGFRVIEHHSLGVLPQSDDRSYLTSWNVARSVEGANLRRISKMHSLGLNTLWLLQKPS